MSGKNQRNFGPKRKILPPNRAIEAVNPAGQGGTATWCRGKDGWFCYSASKHLRWMKGMTDSARTKAELARRQFSWNWIIPLCGGKITPPFQP